MTDASPRDLRVLVLAPTGKDATLTRDLLAQAGIASEACATLDDLLREFHRGAAAMLIPEEVVSSSPDQAAALAETLAQQPPWSDVPVLVLTYAGADSEASDEAARTLGNVTLLERPVRVGTLLSAVRTALRARRRQYQVRGLLAERARSEQALRLADQRKDEFLATLGHELRNPLAPIATGLHLLRLAKVNDPMVRRVTGAMERQVGHLVRLVDDLLEVSRITRGLIEVRREPLDLTLVVREAIDTSRPAVDAGRHQLHVELPPDPVVVSGDAVRLAQVFANLLNNAAKYTDPGGTIWLTVASDGARATVSVKDSGIGIEPHQLAAVFDMFTQVERTQRRAQGGLGIGLTLVRSLVEQHGGKVEARSAGAGRGSEFVVQLPVLQGEFSRVEAADPIRALPARRVLVVDDNRDAGETLGTLLATLGATVSVVDNGPAALRAIDTFSPDVVLLDIGMPGMSGYEVARQVRARGDRPRLVLVALTGWGQAADHRHSREAGFDRHLVKPVSLHQLREVLDLRHGSASQQPRAERPAS